MTTTLIDKDTLHSFVEGGLWSMRLLKAHEKIVAVTYNKELDKYEILLKTDATEDQSELPW